MSQNIIFIGPMGVGKSTIGRLVATQLQREFYDTDQVIIERAGVDIPWIFDVEGEAGFRKREEQAIELTTVLKNVVIATGGGAIISAKNRRCIISRGLVFYIRASFEQQCERVIRAKDTNQTRPLLATSDDTVALIKKLNEEREPLYRGCADHIMESEQSSAHTIANQVVKMIYHQGLI